MLQNTNLTGNTLCNTYASYDEVIIRTNGTYCMFTTSIKYIISKRKFKRSLLDLQHKHGEDWHNFNFDTYHFIL